MCGEPGLSRYLLNVQGKLVLSKPVKWEIRRQCSAKTTTEEARSRPPKPSGTNLRCHKHCDNQTWQDQSKHATCRPVWRGHLTMRTTMTSWRKTTYMRILHHLMLEGLKVHVILERPMKLGWMTIQAWISRLWAKSYRCRRYRGFKSKVKWQNSHRRLLQEKNSMVFHTIWMSISDCIHGSSNRMHRSESSREENDTH